MARLVAAVFCYLTVFIGMAQAQSWVQVEAQPTLAEAEARARAYSRDFPNVNGYQLRSGWYGIALGPFSEPDAVQTLQALRAERLIPGDSFISDGANFSRQFWPVGGAVAVPQPEPVPQVDTTQLPETTAEPLPEVLAEPQPEPQPVFIDETPAEARRSEALLEREDRELIQTAMQWEGFYDSGIDGAFGPGTRAAMASWQEAKGYEGTGVLTTRQRDELIGGYRAVLASLGMQLVRDNTAGIEVAMPTAMVKKGDYQPPFAHYNGDKVRVILISQEGDANTLYGLYEILQTLEIMPLQGPRERKDDSFVIEGSNAEITSYAQAQLTQAGAIKGFILIWPRGDEKMRNMALGQMKSSFSVIPDSVLPDTAGEGGEQSLDLLSGLEIRRPDVSRTGFYFDASGLVLTTADAVGSCQRITIDDETNATVVATEGTLGVAVLKAEVPLAPMGYARFHSGEARLQSEIAVSGYAYDGRLGAPVLTFGRLADVKGLDGEDKVDRLALNVTPGDAGGPVFDGSGAVLGLLLPRASDGQVLPEDVNFAADAAAIAEFLSNQGYTATAAEPAGDIAPEELTRRARDMTVLVSCWN